MLTSWGRRHAECSSKSPSDTKSDLGNPLAITVSQCMPSRCTCSSWTSRKLFNWLHNVHEKLWIFSATRLDVLCFINKENFSLSLINTMWLRGNILSILMRRTIMLWKGKFDSSKMKQMRDFLKDSELLSRFSQEVDQALDDQREILVTEVTTGVWRRDEHVFDLRTELRS